MSTITLGRDHTTESFTAACSDAIRLRAGCTVEKPHERAREFRGKSLPQLARACLASRGLDVGHYGDIEVLKLCLNQRAFNRELDRVSLMHSTSDFDYILQDASGKTLRQAYETAPSTWSIWAKRTTTPDFKTVSRAQLSAFGELLAIKEGGEYTFATISDQRQTYTLAKYGRGFSITWESLINDDLSAFSQIPTAMGRAARRLEDSLVYETIFGANAGAGQTMQEDSLALFASGHANTGSAAALSTASLAQTESLMRSQKMPGSADSLNGGDFLHISPRYLLVGPALHVTASQLAVSIVDPGKNNATPNPFFEHLKVVVEPRLGALDSNGWWLVADYNEIDTAEVCFLESEPAPVIEEENAFDIDGRRYKVRHSVATAAIDYRGFAKNAGA